MDFCAEIFFSFAQRSSFPLPSARRRFSFQNSFPRLFRNCFPIRRKSRSLCSCLFPSLSLRAWLRPLPALLPVLLFHGLPFPPVLPAFLLLFHPALPGSWPVSPPPFWQLPGVSAPVPPAAGGSLPPASQAFLSVSVPCGSVDVHKHPDWYDPQNIHPCLARIFPPFCDAVWSAAAAFLRLRSASVHPTGFLLSIFRP